VCAYNIILCVRKAPLRAPNGVRRRSEERDCTEWFAVDYYCGARITHRSRTFIRPSSGLRKKKEIKNDSSNVKYL